MNRKITVKTGEPYPIYIRQGGLANLPELLHKHLAARQIFIITDEHVAPLYANAALQHLRQEGFRVERYVLPAGESTKSQKHAQDLYTWLIEKLADRSSVIIAFGGGVIGDLAGFTAATFMRGIPLVQIPTTVISQVDSSVGGKVGINHPQGKNMIGAFYQPQFVLIDPYVLSSLSKQQIRAGFGEVIKYGFIADQELYQLLAESLDDLFSLKDMNTLQSVLETCCQIKADVVTLDERENGLRAILNFGHTIGHALEAVTHYDCFLHGEAVVHGMKAALYLSYLKGYLDRSTVEESTLLLNQFKPPSIPAQIKAADLISAIQKDKKRTAKGQTWVLLQKIGRAHLEQDVSDNCISQSIAFMKEMDQP